MISIIFYDFFTSNKYKYDINTTNKMGMKGEMAVVYADIVRQMWSSNENSIAGLGEFSKNSTKLATEIC